MKQYKHEILDRRIAYFHFYEGADAETYDNAFLDFKSSIVRPEITRLMIVLDTIEDRGKMIEAQWVRMSNCAEVNGVQRWGIVTPNSFVRWLSIHRLVSKNGREKYHFFVSQKAEEVMDWITGDPIARMPDAV